MRRAVPYVLVFVAGAVVGLLGIRPTGCGRSAPDSVQGVLATLDRIPPATPLGETDLIRAAAAIQPAVVNIDTLAERRTEMLDMRGNAFERTQMLQGTGSGVALSSDGYLATNNHVVEGADIIRVTTSDGRRFDGRVVGADEASDLAIVKIDARDLPVARLGNSDALRVGEVVLAIGNPLGVGTTVTHGIVSATNRRDLPVGSGRVISHAIQTDAAINKGNSGGALTNLRGEVVGINTAIYSDTGGNIGIGFAIPMNQARAVLKRLILAGRSKPAPPAEPYIGVIFAVLTPRMAEALALPRNQGLIVEEVRPLTPAADAGLHRGDVVLEVDGRPVRAIDDVRRVIARHRVGDTLNLTLLRGEGEREVVKVILGRKPTPH